jgi:hypothetical protein
MKLTVAVIWVFSLALTYEFAFMVGSDSEKLNIYLAEQKVKNCVETIINLKGE